MRRLSDETRILFEELEMGSLYLLLTLTSKRKILDRIGAEGGPAEIPRLLPYAFDNRPAVARAAARALASLVSRTSVSELPWLDKAIRAQVHSNRWDALKPSDVESLTGLEGSSRGLSLLLTCHPSGYVRERAVSKLENTDDEAELAFLLIRLNDWVAPIRDLAAKLVGERARSESARAIVAALPVVAWLRQVQRADPAGVVEGLLSVLREPASAHAVRGGMGSSDRYVRREAFEMGLGLENADGFVRDAIEDPDVLLRVRAARRVSDTFSGERLERMLRRLEHDPTTAVRREALNAYVELMPARAEAKLLGSLFDKSSGLRHFCQFHLRTRFQRDVASEYRRTLAADTALLRESIMGLGETGESADCDSLTAHLDDRRPSVRAAAVWALSRLAKSPPIGDYLRALEDESASVSRRAREALELVASAVPPSELGAMCAETKTWHVFENALLVGSRLELWESLPLILTAAGHEDPKRSALGCRLADGWVRRSSRIFVGPSSAQLHRSRAALDASRHKLPAKLLSELALAVRTAAASK